MTVRFAERDAIKMTHYPASACATMSVIWLGDSRTRKGRAGMSVDVDTVKQRLRLSQDELAAYCQRWKIVEISLIDSEPDNDVAAETHIELLVRFQPGVMRRYADAVAMEREMADLVGLDVELVDYRSVVDWSDNYIRRRTILESAQTVYAA